MIYNLENNTLKIIVKDLGAELASFYDKLSGRQYLWQGKSTIWSGQSPILFPIIGRLLDDKYRVNGKEYSLPKHGFARKKEFSLVEQTDYSLTFVLKDDEETLEQYPWHFELYVTFALEGRALKVTHRVKNINDSVMYFSLGAHPAFNCKIGDYLEFDCEERLISEKIDLVDSLRIDDTIPVLNRSRKIVITEDIFNEDALILSGIKSENITFKAADGEYYVKFNLGKAPYLGLWAKPGAPYVCIEPWCGVNDTYDKKADISQKDAIVALMAGETFEFTWSAEI